MPETDLSCFPFGSANALLRALRQGKVSSVELLNSYLARVDRFNPALNAIVVDDRQAALKQARAADRSRARGETLGALHGLPMTVKEAFDLRGHASTQGYPHMTGNVAVQDALAVQRLKAAGAVVFGKSNVPLNNGDFQSYNAVYGTSNNPWDLTRSPGGSSGGGAAAVAAGLVGMEFGSDIGGSIRNPAAYCGVYGHKSTWSVIPKRGHALARTPVAEADLGVLGPLARSAQDLALALRVAVGPDQLNAAGLRYQLPAPPRTVAGLRVAVWLDQAGAEVDDAVRGPILAAALALRKAGAKVNFNARPDFEPEAANGIYMALLLAQVSARRPDYAQLAELRKALPDHDRSEVAQQLRMATPSFKEYFDTNQGRERLRWAWHAFFQQFDVLLTPVTSTAAFAHDHSEPASGRTLIVNGHATPYFSQLFWAGLATCCYLPATAAPVGFTASGLPVGLQIIGPEMADYRTIWVASQLERLVGGAAQPPGYE